MNPTRTYPMTAREIFGYGIAVAFAAAVQTAAIVTALL